uniref:Hepatitis A virus cellular receptor 1 homolog n=1 Tax=Acanthochromis polyacanthus TaxID=80966 RepID=A0A3Q1G1W5_9TELE
MLLLHIFTCVCLLSGVSAVTTETVVGVVGQTVMLPCRSEAANQRGVEVCWGRGEPSLFTCHNAVIDSSGERITYRKSYRFSLSSSSSLSISSSQPSDAGFYHCRLQLPGLFNDQTSSVHLIIIDPRPVFSSEPSKRSDDEGNLNAPWTTTARPPAGTYKHSADVCWKHSENFLHRLHPRSAADCCLQSLEAEAKLGDRQEDGPIRGGHQLCVNISSSLNTFFFFNLQVVFMNQILEFLQRKVQTAGRCPRPADLNTMAVNPEDLSLPGKLQPQLPNVDGGSKSLQFI